MAWIELHQALVSHRKTMVAADLLDMPPVHLVGHLVTLWLWALDNAEDGELGHVPYRTIARVAQWDGEPETFIQALISAGFLDHDGDRLSIHDWSDYAGRLIQKRQANTKRMREARATNVHNTNGARATNVHNTNGARAGATVPNRTQQYQTETTSPTDVPPVEAKKIPSNLEEWLETLKTEKGSKNPVAVVAFAAHVLVGGDPSETRGDHSRVGMFCKRLNSDYGYALRLLWEASASRPAGDLISYVEARLRASQKATGQTKAKVDPVQATKDWLEGKI